MHTPAEAVALKNATPIVAKQILNAKGKALSSSKWSRIFSKFKLDDGKKGTLPHKKIMGIHICVIKICLAIIPARKIQGKPESFQSVQYNNFLLESTT